MPVTPEEVPDSAEPARRATSLVEWLRRRSDRRLTRLLRLRPDLALPAPADVAALAARLSVRTSTQRSVDGLDARTLRVLEGLVLAAGDDDSIDITPDDDSADALEELFDRVLVWGDPDLVHLTPTVREAVGPYPAGLGRPAAALFPLVPDNALVPILRRLGLPPTAQPAAGIELARRLRDPVTLAETLEQADAEERDVLARLAAGPPVGTLRSTRLAAAEADQSAPHRLINRGLLVPIDTQRVELPREVGIALRHGPRSDLDASAPEVRLVDRTPDDLDRLGTTAVLEALRLVDSLAELWTAHAPALLRSGGIGVRELKRAAKELAVDDTVAALIAEIAYAAGLVNSTNGPEPVFLPSTEYDAWRRRDTADRWTVLAATWLGMTRQPSLISMRGERDRVIAALGPDAERGTIPALRRQVLDLLTALPPGSAPADRDEVLALLAWQQPRRASGQRAVVEAILAEADRLGITAAGGLTGYTRTLLAAPTGPGRTGTATSAAAAALDRALPAPVDHFLVQPDLTVVVPGPPEPSMGVELGLIADLESTGGASVYRITERSVRRALDAGRTGEQLGGFVAARSRTPVPQALQYLIDDAARRHGVLRAGAASAYLRCDDESLLARVLTHKATASLDLRLIAPTVVITEAPVTRVLDVLREAGFAPAAESADGVLVTLGAEPRRSSTRPPSRSFTTRGAAETDAQLGELVRRLRSGDALTGADARVQAIAAQIPGVTSAATMELLRRAVRAAQLVWFGCAEADGTTTAHTIQPISLAAGTVRGYEQGRPGLVSYPVHRITAIRVLDDAEGDPETSETEN
ncbi:MAG TPA: helicase-associated domain-containing protein [Jatrophihabitans sp.]|uniref:helicase-associated domain-containing protein n=1 Tax=Jatrophihabitans sp. TaxID=1932789 RepID=UPI002DFA1494|nr:helicase-associated domain-containing protein [Jatrophihabitans sp.]